MVVDRLLTPWHALSQPSWPYTIALQHHPTTYDACLETLTEVRTYAISRCPQACTHDLPIAGQSGMVVERLLTPWHALYQPS